MRWQNRARARFEALCSIALLAPMSVSLLAQTSSPPSAPAGAIEPAPPPAAARPPLTVEEPHPQPQSQRHPLPSPAAPTPSAQKITIANTAVPADTDFMHRGIFPAFWRAYLPWTPSPIYISNPSGLEEAARSGTIYLSVKRTVELALRDNLDIAEANYERLFARTDILRAQSGAATRGVTGAQQATTLFSGAIGAGVGGGGNGFGTGAGSVTGGGVGINPSVGGSYDPTVSVIYEDTHSREPLDSVTLFGTSQLVTNGSLGGVFYGQAFPTGTAYGVSAFSLRSYYNSESLLFNPEVASTVSFSIDQRLLNGFSTASNKRFIITAQNDQKITDEVFRRKVIEVVAGAVEDYWALAKLQLQAQIAAQGSQLAEKLVSDTRDIVAAGRAPESSLIQVESELAQRRQEQITAETQYRQEATKLKLELSRQYSPALVAANIVTTDPLPQATNDRVMTPQQAVVEGLRLRPEIEQSRLNLANYDVAVKATKNELLPTLDVFAQYAVSGVAGVPCTLYPAPCPAASGAPSNVSGLWDSFRTSLRGNYPDYGVGFSLNFPIFNRTARADEARSQFEYAQAQVRLRNQENQLSQQVASAALELQGQAEQQSDIRQSMQLAQQTLANENERYKMGSTTVLTVIAAQKALLDLERSEAGARAAYGTAKVELAKVVGTILDDYNVAIAPVASADRGGR
jgi:outer membrane protein